MTDLHTKFADMTDQQRERWVKWCFRHDWCTSAGQNGCREFFVESAHEGTHKFVTPQDLRNWAGY